MITGLSAPTLWSRSSFIFSHGLSLHDSHTLLEVETLLCPLSRAIAIYFSSDLVHQPTCIDQRFLSRVEKITHSGILLNPHSHAPAFSSSSSTSWRHRGIFVASCMPLRAPPVSGTGKLGRSTELVRSERFPIRNLRVRGSEIKAAGCESKPAGTSVLLRVLRLYL